MTCSNDKNSRCPYKGVVSFDTKEEEIVGVTQYDFQSFSTLVRRGKHALIKWVITEIALVYTVDNH